MSIANFKDAFAASRTSLHLNNAGVAPICRPAFETVLHWAKRMREDGTFAYADLFAANEHTRQSLGRLLNAPAEQIAFFPGAAYAISQFAFGLDLKEGDEILLWDQEYPSNFYPWRDAALRAGAKIVVAKSDAQLSAPVDRLLSLVTDRTRVVAFSWVQYQTGALTDIEPIVEIAQKRNLVTFADVIQGVGALPFDFAKSGLDAVVGGSHKWLASPLGVGFLAAKQNIFSNLRPLAVGAMTYGTPDDLASMEAVEKPGPARFEPGSRPVIEIAALGAALDLFLDAQIDAVSREALSLARLLTEGLQERGYEVQNPNSRLATPIVNVKPGAKSKCRNISKMETALRSANVAYALRAGGIRLSPHGFNLQQEVEQLLGVL